MPRMIDAPDDQMIELGDCVAGLEAQGFDPSEEENLQGAARLLRQLGNNPDFLARIMLSELKTRHQTEETSTSYGAQVVMLSRPGGDFFIRANIWPSRSEHAFRASGADAFVYGLPHDHNFDFLTLGYFGPGYVSDYYEYDYESVHGAVGEPVDLRFVERSALTQGKLMHYRTHRDVHSQWPAESLSCSLNVMHAPGAQGWTDQYRFDVENGRIAGALNTGSSEVFLRIAVGLGCENARDLACHFAARHPSERMRLTALDAQAGVLDPAQRDALWRHAESSGSGLVAMEAKRRREALAGT